MEDVTMEKVKAAGPDAPATHKLTVRDYCNEAICGAINAAIIIPVMFSFANIIFRDPIFAPFLPQLSKLVMFSGVVHQLAFMVFSNFPFAVGQVQDAGLVFLSSMSTDVVLRMTGGATGYTDQDIVATTLFVLAISTASLGVCVYIVGRLNLASAVQYLPMPVLAGYLAYIGFFCGISAFGIMADKDVATIYDFPQLISVKSAILIFPGVIGGVLIYCSLRFLRSSLTLPLCMIVILSSFFSIMYMSGMSIEEARNYGWIHAYSDPGSVTQAVALYDLKLVEWSLFLGQITKFLAMVVVVTVSSSLDIAAIEMELGRPVDYNQELKTVGLSNLLSGLFGGYTGSYIFSQTIFCLRRGIKSKFCGFTIMLCEFLVVIFPISITAYIPKVFFGSLLMLISLDLQWEWLIASRHKMMTSEYLVSIATFVCIQLWGIEAGMFIGVLGAALSFVGLYSQLEVVSVSAQRTSNAQRTFEERLLLMSKHRKIVTLTFRGYIFFGSAASLLPVLKSYMENVALPGPESAIDMNDVPSQEDKGISYSSGAGGIKSVHASASFTPDNSDDDSAEFATPSRKKWQKTEASERTHLLGSSSPSPDYGGERSSFENNSPAKVLKDIAGLRKVRSESMNSDVETGATQMKGSNKTEFMVFDFTDTHGVDSTACRSCFALVTSLIRGYTDATLVFTGMLPAVETLFRSHGIIEPQDVVINSLNEGLEWCEENLLRRYMPNDKQYVLHSISSTSTSLENLQTLNSQIGGKVCNQSYTQRAALERQNSLKFVSTGVDRTSTEPTSIIKENEFDRLRDIIEDYLEVHSSLMDMTSTRRYLAVGTLAKYFRIMQVDMGELVFNVNDVADSVYFLDSGLIQLLRYPSLVAIPPWNKTTSAEELHQQLSVVKKQGAFHICKVTTGGIFGDNSFILSQPHSMRAVALMRSYIFVLSRERFHDMEKNHPKLLFILQQVLMKSTAISGETTIQQLYPAPWKAI